MAHIELTRRVRADLALHGIGYQPGIDYRPGLLIIAPSLRNKVGWNLSLGETLAPGIRTIEIPEKDQWLFELPETAGFCCYDIASTLPDVSLLAEPEVADILTLLKEQGLRGRRWSVGHRYKRRWVEAGHRTARLLVGAAVWQKIPPSILSAINEEIAEYRQWVMQLTAHI